MGYPSFNFQSFHGTRCLHAMSKLKAILIRWKLALAEAASQLKTFMGKSIISLFEAQEVD